MALQGERRCCDEGILIDSCAGFSTVREWGNNWSKFDDVIEVMLGMLRCPTYQLPTRPVANLPGCNLNHLLFGCGFHYIGHHTIGRCPCAFYILRKFIAQALPQGF